MRDAMVLFDGVLGLVMLGLWIFCIIDAITTPADRVRNLPKLVWLILVVLLVDIGSIAWLIAGRNWGPKDGLPVGAPRAPGTTHPTNPDDDEDFLAGLRKRAEEQRRRARDQGTDEQLPDA